MAINNNLVALIDDKIKAAGGTPRNPDKGPRHHLGASIIGRECWREIWYSWRWASPVQFEGRMLRLFDRGHEEEHRFADWLRLIGCEVEQYDPTTGDALWYHDGSDSYITLPRGEDPPSNEPLDDVSHITWHVERAKWLGVKIEPPRQHGFKDTTGHFAGSMDGIIWNVPEINIIGFGPETKILGEFKTHNAKSFDRLINMCVKDAKPEHYGQMATYMAEKQLPLALYCAVNKDTDAMHFEYVWPDPAKAAELRAKAIAIIGAKKPPARISNSPSWFGCRFCDHRMSCHMGDPMVKNCRTCRFSSPVANGEWHCSVWDRNIPKEAQPIGCGKYMPIHD